MLKKFFTSQTNNDREFIYSMLIAEQKSSLEDVYEGMTASKRYVQTIFASSSLLIAMISALQVFSDEVLVSYSSLYFWGVIIVAVLYVVQVALCVKVMAPANALGPIGSDWDKLHKSYVTGISKIEAQQQLLADYIYAIKANEPIMIKRGRLAKWTGYLFPVIVLLLFVLSFINRIPSL